MLRNYFKIAFRALWKRKGFSLINLTGLAVGMAVAMLLGFWVVNELSYDRFYENEAQLYRVMLNRTANGTITTQPNGPTGLADALRNEIPEIKSVSEELTGLNTPIDGLRVGETKLMRRGQYVGISFLEMFRLPLLQGNAQRVLREPNSIVLTEETAKALFGTTKPMNQIVRLNNRSNLKVTGILKSLPSNTAWDFTFLIPITFLETNPLWIQSRSDWNNNGVNMTVELKPNVDYAKIAPKLKGIVKRHNPTSVFDVFLYPVSQWHLYGEFKNGKSVGGFIESVRLFGLVGLAVLLLACINFMNLSTARSEKRAKEVGIRKAVGSQRSQLITQFLSESLLVTGLAFVLALGLVLLFLPAFNELTEKRLSLPFHQPIFWVLALGFTILTGLLAGSYPAFYLSSFRAVRVLKGSVTVGRNASWPRKILVVSQFTVSITLIICAAVIYQQIQHTKNRPVGYKSDRLLMVTPNDELVGNYAAIKSELLRSGVVESVARASGSPTVISSDTRIDWSGKGADEIMRVNLLSVSPDYLKTMGMALKTGRNFNENNADVASVLLNEAAVKAMRLTNPIGQKLTMVWNPGQTLEVIGVVKNAVMESPYAPVNPLMLLSGSPFDGFAMIRLSAGINSHQALERIQPIFQKLNPAFPFDYHFVNDEYNHKFKQEELIGKLASVFAILAVFISCLGLFGLAAYMAEQRTKEIGIRKVLGATVLSIWGLLSKDFVWLVGIACLIASPLAAFFLNDWLSHYEYRISLGIGVFFLAGVVAIGITLLTISAQSIKAALMNPVKSLKSE